MPRFVLDASAACSLCFEDEDPELSVQVIEALQHGDALVPALFLWEVANVLLGAEKRGRMNRADRVSFLKLLEELGLQIDPVDPGVIWHDVINLAAESKLTSYDAAYLELALREGLPLASADRALNSAATACGVPLLSN
ncbi:MAG: type II toxin-antitoxin system VapC family toxin [Cyanobacteria bacterium K_DeepCast_35m_m2_155]|nr:type II toxin-antitoxin system VapC family toxin [Cyanobacteria bacterium K_DeepCast_35m_m2_155]